MHLTSKQATEKYNISLRTLRNKIANLSSEQRAKFVLIEGKKHLISAELLDDLFPRRKDATVQMKSTIAPLTKAPRTDAPRTDASNGAKMVQNDVLRVQNEQIAHLQSCIAHLQSDTANLHDRLKECNYIIANLSKQLTPPTPQTNKTDIIFAVFIAGFIFGFFVVGVVIWLLY